MHLYIKFLIIQRQAKESFRDNFFGYGHALVQKVDRSCVPLRKIIDMALNEQKFLVQIRKLKF